jgi:broad-specificity NMP kinase
MKDYDLIIVGGAPGTGKTTVFNIINSKLKNVYIDFGDLRVWHLDDKWTNVNKKEEMMAFDNLVFIIKNYFKNEYTNIVVTDLLYYNAVRLNKIFSTKKVLFVILTCDEKELAKRVGNHRKTGGFNNVKLAIRYNNRWKNSNIKGVIKIDNSDNNPKVTANKILKIIKN